MAAELLSHINQGNNPNSNKRYAGKPVAEIIANGFFTVDHKWTVRYWNKAAEQLVGVLAKDIVGKNIWKEVTGVIPADLYAVYHKAFLQDGPVHFEEYWGEMGAWVNVIIYYSDDTLSVSFKSKDHPADTEQQLKILNELYQFITEVTNDCLWEWDLQHKELFWIDGGHKRTFGYAIENALIPQSFWESRLHPDDKMRILTGLNKIIREGSFVWEDEYRFKRADGDYAYVHDRGHIIYENGEASRMIGATQDITARKLTEIKLVESEEKLSLITRQKAEAVIITDNEGKITWVNDAFTRITEYRQDEVIGKKPGNFLQGEDTDPLTIEYLRQKIKEKLPFDCKLINYTKSGRKYWMHIRGVALLDEDGNCGRFCSIQTDITEKLLSENRSGEEKLAQQKEMTVAALTSQENERMEIGNELHNNLNQVLAVAKLYIQMAQTDEMNRETTLHKSQDLIADVIGKIRTITKNLVIPEANIIGLVDNIKNLLKDRMLVQPVKIEFQVKDIIEENLDGKQQLTIFRIVQEQVNNILKHSKATDAMIDLGRDENKIVLLISDNGEGCDLQKKTPGVGIINIKSRVELYGGNVVIISKPGEGYRLEIVLPFK